MFDDDNRFVPRDEKESFFQRSRDQELIEERRRLYYELLLNEMNRFTSSTNAVLCSPSI